MKNKTILISLCMGILAITACKKEKSTITDSLARRISESENLEIPAAVNLPPANSPGGYTRVATYFAEGVQKYKAQLKAGAPGTYEWVFVAPQANLYDASNRIVGTHGAGPNWALSPTDSIYGQHFTPAKTVTSPTANSIDWLLLMPKAGKVPTGIFANVAYIQRIATVGGKAPDVLPTSAAETVEVKYTAIYRFTKKNP